MDIDENDLLELFQMIDTDGSGAIEAPEFIKPLSRWVHEPWDRVMLTLSGPDLNPGLRVPCSDQLAAPKSRRQQVTRTFAPNMPDIKQFMKLHA